MNCNTVFGTPERTATLFFGGRTPIFGGRTPNFGDRTPKFGGRTLNLVAETLISYSNDFLNNTGTVRHRYEVFNLVPPFRFSFLLVSTSRHFLGRWGFPKQR